MHLENAAKCSNIDLECRNDPYEDSDHGGSNKADIFNTLTNTKPTQPAMKMTGNGDSN